MSRYAALVAQTHQISACFLQASKMFLPHPTQQLKNWSKLQWSTSPQQATKDPVSFFHFQATVDFLSASRIFNTSIAPNNLLRHPENFGVRKPPEAVRRDRKRIHGEPTGPGEVWQQESWYHHKASRQVGSAQGRHPGSTQPTMEKPWKIKGGFTCIRRRLARFPANL